MLVGVPKEIRPGERRIAATPDTIAIYRKAGFQVQVEPGAGEHARIRDADLTAAGATLADAATIWSTSDVILKVAAPTSEEVAQLRHGATVISQFDGDEHDPLIIELAARRASFFALGAVPRTTRAQSMDIRSSMANLAGYRAVLEAAARFGRPLGAQTTAAGSTPPARVLVIGAGVAGLAAIAAARGLGATVYAFDTRAAAREQVESLGARFLTVEIQESGEGVGGYAKEMSKAFLDAEFALFRAQAVLTDIVITTALIPNKPAPKLWLADMVEAMRPGSVVVDMAACRGGNCQLTVPDEVVERHGVTLVGIGDLTQSMVDQASRLLARNVASFVGEFGKAAAWKVDLSNPILRCTCVLEQGDLRWPAPPPEPSPAPPVKAAAPPPPPPQPQGLPARLVAGLVFASVSVLLLVARFAPAEFLQHLTVFALACVIGWQVVWNVTPALHTPLMSVTNAVSGIIVIGGLLQVASGSGPASFLGFLAILFASINIFGGFAVTHRMLGMFRKHEATP